MVDFFYKGNMYRMVLNSKMFACVNVLFLGYIFIGNKRYKKYMSASKTLYLVEA